MRVVPTWDEYFLDIAHTVAQRSKDPSTQVGAVVVDQKNRILSTGYNGFPAGTVETPDMWERPAKYDRVLHAELNAVAHAASKGHCIDGGTLYCTHHPCIECAKMLIASGIRIVVMADSSLDGWESSNTLAYQLFREAGVYLKCMTRNWTT